MAPTVLRVFTEIVLPIFVVVGLGYYTARARSVLPTHLSTVTLYLFTPCLTFSALTRTTMQPGDALQIVLFVLLHTAAMYVLSSLMAGSFRLDRASQSAFVLTSVIGNVGNFGLSLVLLAFGDEGLERAVIYFICGAIQANSIGVFIASRSQRGITDSFRIMLRMPALWAALAAVVVLALGIPVPAIVATPAEMLGNAAIPTMLVILGAQLATTPKIEGFGKISAVSGVRLVLSAGVAYGLVVAMGLTGVTRDVLILQSAMPTAVNTIIVATEFGANPQFVTGVVVVSTLASLGTITLLLTLMLSG